MQAINCDFQPINRITTPLTREATYTNSGIIKAVTKNGDKICIAQIDYLEFDEENFQYVISPYWEIIDGLPTSVFQGIPGINMELRLKNYYRVNYIPTFIAERTPSENREDLWEILNSVGLDYYDRFEWLLRTDMRAANDNLIVRRRRTKNKIAKFSPSIISELQYGDLLIANSLEQFADTASGFSDIMFKILINGIDVITPDGKVLIDKTSRAEMLPFIITQRTISLKEREKKQQQGIEKAKRNGKYTGRKRIETDEHTLRQVASELETELLSVEEAMKRVNLKSKSTFYRRLRELK